MRPLLTRLAVIAGFFVLGLLAMTTRSNVGVELLGVVVFAWLGWTLFRRVRNLYDDT